MVGQNEFKLAGAKFLEHFFMLMLISWHYFIRLILSNQNQGSRKKCVNENSDYPAGAGNDVDAGMDNDEVVGSIPAWTR